MDFYFLVCTHPFWLRVWKMARVCLALQFPVVFSSRREAEVTRGSRVRSECSVLGFLGCHVAGSQMGTC